MSETVDGLSASAKASTFAKLRLDKTAGQTVES
jgi:hypothetical protein